MADLINVEVVYALPHQHQLVRIQVPEGATVRDAIDASGVLARFPEIDLDKANKVGVFGKLTRLDTMLRERDRVEIYRPLIADPKEVRKKRAEEGKAAKKGGGTAT
ncbi:MAG TPA: RnfH family protein [Aromatoleum sp.]|uniref:RnfH family protein n=1 Tax=Aromatoleum sp. TaxID=2307007 RepID=UPI002B46AFF3|nr:RnfH family protein [Aromatoleum sp.]HJV27709.1 RnfH family protein [Aromatoleum sp.]